MTTATEKKNATRLPMITAGRVGFTKDRIQEMVLANKKAEHDLFHVVGSASQAQVKESKDYEDRESIEFRGSFLAIDCESGEQFKSGKVYLPSVIEAELAAAVQRNGLCEIALTVTASFSEKAPSSYAYGIRSYGEEDNTAFEALLAKIPGVTIKALAAPKAEKPAAKKKK
jgi:hypothetical protein